jgi:hypothetical protein
MIRVTITPKGSENIYGLLVKKKLSFADAIKALSTEAPAKSDVKKSGHMHRIRAGFDSKGVWVAQLSPWFRHEITVMNGNC